MPAYLVKMNTKKRRDLLHDAEKEALRLNKLENLDLSWLDILVKWMRIGQKSRKVTSGKTK